MGRFFAGAAKVEITPPRLGIRMGGHAVNRRSVGVRDPLFAHALAIRTDEDVPLVLVSLDLVGLMHGFVEKIRDRVPELDRRRVWICTTHTHDAPDTIGFWGPMIAEVPLRSGLDHDYMDFAIDRTAEAIRLAVSDQRPAKLRAARLVAPRVGWTRNVRDEAQKDDAVEILHAQDRQGATIALVYHYACHPEFMGHHNRWISAGWPGVANATLEGRLGGTAFLLQNALGGMVTGAVSRDDGAFDPQVGQPFAQRLGRWVGEAILDALPGAKAVRATSIKTAHRSFDAQVTNRLFRLCGHLNIFPRWMLGAQGDTVRTEIDVARFGSVTMATVPGEALPEVGFAFKARLGAAHPWVVNLGNDELGYLLSPEAWRDPRYEYERSMSIGASIVPELQRYLNDLLDEVQ